MFELIFLGTSASVPSTDRNQAGILVSAGGSRILIDCGEGTQRQLLRSGAGFRRLSRLLLTHGHLDHVLGIPGLLATMGLQQSTGEMIVNGSPRALEAVSRLLAGLWGEGNAPIELAFTPVIKGTKIHQNGFSITPFPVLHRDTDSFGYSFEGVARRHLQGDRLAGLAIPDGPIRKGLAAGLRATLPDGRLINPEDVLGPVENGPKLVIVGDVETVEGLAGFVDHADILVIEATFLEKDAALARNYGHLTAARAAALAAAGRVKRLILTHISGRYPAGDIVAEAKQFFPAVEVANDFQRCTI